MPRPFVLPGTQRRFAPDQPCRVRHYRIEIDLDVKNKRFSGVCTLRLEAIGKTRSSVDIDAVEMDIFEVEGASGPLAFVHDGRQLRVAFDSPLETGKSLDIRVHYQTTPRRGLYFVGPDQHYPDKEPQVWSQGQDQDSRYWFPCLDTPAQKASSELIVTGPKDFFFLSNGTLVDDGSSRGRRRMHWRLDAPHSCYLITLAGGRFFREEKSIELSEEAGGKLVELGYYGDEDKREDALRTLAKTPEMVELYSRLFGVPYPYDKYAQVFVADFVFGGMENTTATTLTDLVLVDERAALDFDIESLVCHELAHQWFGDLLTCRDWGEAWLHEGFATYSEYLWREHAEGPDAAGLELADFTQAYLAEDKGRYRRAIVNRDFEVPLDIFDRHLYDKAARVVHMLRRVLGDEDFFGSLGHYLRKHANRVVETRDLARAIEEHTGRSLDWFFEQWVMVGAGHPVLKVKLSYDAEQKLLWVDAEQTQERSDDCPETYRLPTQIQVVCCEQNRTFELELRHRKERQHLFVPHAPEQIIFDPGKHLLCELECDKSPALWFAQLAKADQAADRIEAAAACGRLGSLQARSALVASLSSDAFWGVRRASATALGKVRGSDARDALLAALETEEDHRVRRGIVAALGSFRDEEDVAQCLESIVEEGDASLFVEAEACFAMARCRTPRAAELLREALERDSFMNQVRRHAYRGLAEIDDATAIPLLLEHSRYGRPSAGRRESMVAAAQLAARGGDGKSDRVRLALERFVRDPDFRAKLGAIEALRQLGDAKACAALQELVDEGFDGRVVRMCREAIADLKDGRTKEEELKALRATGEELQKKVRDLEERMEKLEFGSKTTSPAPASAPGPAPSPAPARQRRTGGKKSIPAIRRG